MISFEEVFPDSPHAVAGGDLEVVRLGESPTLVMLFTNECVALTTHYLNLPNLRGEFQCNEKAEGICLLCDLKERPTARILLPVYDIATQFVKVLLVSGSRHPGALGPLIRHELRQGRLHDRMLMISRNATKFAVQSVPLSEGSDRGESVIISFLERVQAGEIHLERSVPVTANSELLDVPELARKIQALGLDRKRYQAVAPEATTLPQEKVTGQ